MARRPYNWNFLPNFYSKTWVPYYLTYCNIIYHMHVRSSTLAGDKTASHIQTFLKKIQPVIVALFIIGNIFYHSSTVILVVYMFIIFILIFCLRLLDLWGVSEGSVFSQ